MRPFSPARLSPFKILAIGPVLVLPQQVGQNMRNKVLIMIALAVVFGMASVFMVNTYLTAAQKQTVAGAITAAPGVDFDTLVVAAEPLGYGDRLTAERLIEIPWPREHFPEGAYRTILEATTDGTRVVLAPIHENEPVLKSELSGKDGRAALSNMLAPGMRAATVRVDEVAGVGGFITPGDRVDVVLTREAQGTTVSQFILQNVKVLSTDHMADTSETGPRDTSWVTLEVDTEMAKKLTLARAVGQISLSLRAAGDETIAAGERATIADLGGLPPVDRQPVGSVEKEPAPVVVRTPETVETVGIIVTRALERTSYDVPGEAPRTDKDMGQ